MFDQSLQIHVENETHSEFQDGMHCDVKQMHPHYKLPMCFGVKLKYTNQLTWHYTQKKCNIMNAFNRIELASSMTKHP